MAIYHIKPPAEDDPASAALLKTPEYPPEEYWREQKPEYARDLDFDEIEELNKAAEEEMARNNGEEDEDELPPSGGSRFGILMALLLIVSFTLWLSFSMVGQHIDWAMLSQSAEMNEDETLARLKEAVVVVEGAGSSGSGFNISEDGLIVTNRHVVEDAGIITIKFSDSQVFTTRNWAEIPDVDMALIDIKGEELPYVGMSPTYPNKGEEVIFIGNPLGFDWTISEGIVKGMVNMEGIPLIYLEGFVYPGSSGSPVFDASSGVIGVIFASLRDEENSGLAIPISYLINYLEDIYEH